MAGLLDFEDPRTMGLLNAGLGIMAQAGDTSRQFGLGQALASGLNTYQQTQLQDEMLKRKKAQEDLAMQMHQMQFGQMQQHIKDQEASKQRAAMLPQILAKYGNDYSRMVRDGVVSPEFAKQLAESQNYGKVEVSRVEEIDSNGKKVKQQFDKFGRPVGDALTAYIAPERIDLNDRVIFQTPQAGLSFTKGMSAADKDASARGWAGFNLQKEQQYKPQWNNEVGAFIAPPSKMNPQGQKIELAGYTKEDKPLTEAQGKATAFSARMFNADKEIGDLINKGVTTPSLVKQTVEKTPLIGGALGAGANSFVASPEQQRMEQAQRDFVNAILRQESGAAIGKDEFESSRRQYFPMVGDSQEVIKQKEQNRKIAIEGMKMQSGKGANQIDSILKKSGVNSGQSDIDALLKKYGG